MAIAFGAATDLGNTSATSLTAAHNCGAGSDRFLAVAVIGDIGSGSDDVTGVTYNGVAMTLAEKISDVVIARFGYLYTLTNPASGTNNVVVSCTTPHFLAAGAVHWTGVKQTGQPEVQNKTFSNEDVDVSLTTAITPLTANSWVILGAFGYDGAGATPPLAGTGSTRRTYDPTYGLWGIFDSNSDQPASSYSMEWHYVSGTAPDLASVMLAIAPAAGSSASSSVSSSVSPSTSVSSSPSSSVSSSTSPGSALTIVGRTVLDYDF
jgi:hypothetical protein